MTEADHPQKGGDPNPEAGVAEPGTGEAMPAASFVVGVETFEEALEEVKPWLARHYQETSPWSDKIVLDPDYRRYAYLSAQGKLRVYVGRDNSKVVAYATFILGTHLHHQKIFYSVNDIFYVEPGHRGKHVATALFDLMEDEMRNKFYCSYVKCDPRIKNPAAMRFLESRGYDLITVGYGKLL